MSPPIQRTPAASARPAAPQAPGLEEFLHAFRDTNPFSANRVNEPSSYDVDVEEINSKQFDRLVKLSAEAIRTNSGIGVVVYGGAGVGKSHLLSRLYRWAQGPPNGSQRACYIYLHNVLAEPERLARYLLKCVVSRLSEGGRDPLHTTPLFRFVDRAIRYALDGAGIQVDNVSAHLKEAVEAYRKRFFTSNVESRYIFEVLFHFWRYARPEKAADPSRRHMASQALTWLSGDEIDAQDAMKFNLRVEGDRAVMLQDDQDVEHVFAALSTFAKVSGQPLILCIDQADNLDPEKLTRLVRFLHVLNDHTPNLLSIVCGVKSTLLRYAEDGVIPEAAWDRLAQYQIDLKRLPVVDARKIIEARLQRFLEPFEGLEAVNRRFKEDRLFPLGEEWLKAQVGDALEIRPRDILTWARDAWEDEQAGMERVGVLNWIRGRNAAGPAVSDPKPAPNATVKPAAELIDAAIDKKMEEHSSELKLHQGSLPPDAGNLSGLVEALLSHCLDDKLTYTLRAVARTKKKGGKLPPYDLLIHEQRDQDGIKVSTGLCIVTNGGISATAALRRLLEDENPPEHRLLVTDARKKLSKTGQAAEYYRDLQKLGVDRFQHIEISAAQYAQLDALRATIDMAKSGDLEIEERPRSPRAVLESEVIASHHRKDRFRAHPLLRPLLTEDPPAPVAPPAAKDPGVKLKELRQFIMGQLAWQMGTTAKALAKSYAAAMPVPRATPEVLWPVVKAAAENLHREGKVHATPQDDDLFLLLGK